VQRDWKRWGVQRRRFYVRENKFKKAFCALQTVSSTARNFLNVKQPLFYFSLILIIAVPRTTARGYSIEIFKVANALADVVMRIGGFLFG